MRQYWIEIKTPEGILCLWAVKAPMHEFKIAKRLGYPVAYGPEGKSPTKEWPRGWMTNYTSIFMGGGIGDETKTT